MLDSIQIKKRLSGGGFSDEQAEALAEELASLTESQLVTDTELTARLRRQTIQILLGVVAIDGAFFAAASFLLG